MKRMSSKIEARHGRISRKKGGGRRHDSTQRDESGKQIISTEKSSSDYERFLYSMFSLCYSMVTGTDNDINRK